MLKFSLVSTMEWSSGVILYRDNGERREFFVCTPDGPHWEGRVLYNFPKGHIEGEETPFQAAIREFQEETSIPLTNDESKYIYYGIVNQNKKKNVHVFIKKWEGEDTEHCVSNMCTSAWNGHIIEHHEVRGYTWMTYDELKEVGMKCYRQVFRDILKL